MTQLKKIMDIGLKEPEFGVRFFLKTDSSKFSCTFSLQFLMPCRESTNIIWDLVFKFLDDPDPARHTMTYLDVLTLIVATKMFCISHGCVGFLLFF